MKRHRVGAVAWVATVLLYPVQLAVAIRWPHGYSITGNAISDLGVTTCTEFSEQGEQVRMICSPWHQFFNVSMTISGLLVLVGALLMVGYWAGRAGLAGSILLAAAGACVAAVGLIPWDVHPELHDLVATGQAMLQWGGMLLVALAAGRGIFRWLTIGAGLVSVIGFVLFLAALEGAAIPVVGMGGAERLSFDVLSIWIVLTGAFVIAKRRPSHPLRAT